MRRPFVAAVLPLLLAACSSWPAGSYVQSVSPSDAAVLAPQIASYLSSALPAGSAIAVASAQANDPIITLLSPALDRDGFNQTITGTPVHYVAAPLDSGIMLRVSIADRQGASQFFSRAASGTISPAGPLTVAQP